MKNEENVFGTDFKIVRKRDSLIEDFLLEIFIKNRDKKI
jgi:hypothetical protein